MSAYWSRPLPQVLAALAASPDGLTLAEAGRRLQRLGPNSLTGREKITRGRTFLRQLTSPIVLILLFATAVSAVVGDWSDAAIIAAIVAGSAWLSASQECRASEAVDRLTAQVTLRAMVLRDGRSQTVPVETIVPGDILLLAAGSLVPADAVLLDARDCFATEAVLTGETFPVEKRPGSSTPLRRWRSAPPAYLACAEVAKNAFYRTGPRLPIRP